MPGPWLAHAGVPAYGLWSGIVDPVHADGLRTLGYDYVCLDLQHGAAELSDARALLLALTRGDTLALVRPRANDLGLIGRVLDLGADGVIVPLVSTPAEAAAAVAACRFPPAGRRSMGPVLARHRARTAAEADAASICLVMIETAEGLENVEAICATSGLDGVYIGPADLALAIGVDPRTWPESPEHAKARARVRVAARDAGIVAGLHCTGPDVARDAVAEGFTMVTVTSDTAVLRSGATEALRRAREG